PTSPRTSLRPRETRASSQNKSSGDVASLGRGSHRREWAFAPVPPNVSRVRTFAEGFPRLPGEPPRVKITPPPRGAESVEPDPEPPITGFRRVFESRPRPVGTSSIDPEARLR